MNSIYGSEKLHVMTVTPLQQLVMRLALNEYFKRQAEYLIATASTTNVKNNDNLITKFEQYFNSYDVCSAGLPSLMSLKHAPPRSLYLTGPAMRYILAAVNEYDPRTAPGPSQLQDAVENGYERLKTLVNLSAEYQYTIQEIKEAGG